MSDSSKEKSAATISEMLNRISYTDIQPVSVFEQSPPEEANRLDTIKEDESCVTESGLALIRKCELGSRKFLNSTLQKHFFYP